MAATPQPPAKPSTPPQQRPSTPPPHQPPHAPPPPRPEAARPSHTREETEPPLPIGAKPRDPHDPQAMKFNPPPGPPAYDGKREDDTTIPPAFTPKPAIDPRAEKPPEDAYVDGMTIAQEQRARSAWIEAHGDAAYIDEIDQRPDDEKPVFDKNALAGGGAFVSQGGKKQIPGVVPPTKRE